MFPVAILVPGDFPHPKIQYPWFAPIMTFICVPGLLTVAFHKRDEQISNRLSVKISDSSLRSAAIFVVLYFAMFWCFYFEKNGMQAPDRFDGAVATLYILEQTLKVILFDALEIWQIQFTEIYPITDKARGMVFGIRLLMTLTVAKYISDLLNYDRFPIAER